MSGHDAEIDDFPLMRWVVKYEHLARHNLGSSNTPGVRLDLSGLSPFDMGVSSNKGQHATLEAILGLYPPGLDAMTANGASEANFLAFHAFAGKGSTVAVESPTYAPLRSVPRSLGCSVVDIPRRFEEGWALDLDVLAEAAPRIDMLVLTHPNNPTGVPMGDGERKAVLDLSADHGFTVLVDEIFRMMAPDELHTLAGHGNVLVTCSLSKSAGISAARCGWVVGHAGKVERVLAAKRIASAATSPIGEAILARTLETYPSMVLRDRPVYAGRMDALARFIASRPEASWLRPPHGCVAFPRFNVPCTTLELAESLLEEDGVLAIPGEFFGWPGFMRLGLGMCEPDEALSLIGSRLDRLSAGRSAR